MDRAKHTRNGMIEWGRFFAAVVIAMFHFEWVYLSHTVYLKHGYIFVEFFFCLSGYFLAKKQQDPQTAKDAIPYVWLELKKLYPLYITAFLICFVEHCIIDCWNTFELILQQFRQAKWESLLLVELGLAGSAPTYNQGGAVDYISAMLLASFLLCWLIRYHKKMFENIVGPFLVLIGYSYILTTAGSLSQWRVSNGWLCLGVVRALAGMSSGALSYLIFRPVLYTKPCKQGEALLAIGFVGWIVYGNGVDLFTPVLCVPVFAYLLAALDRIDVTAEKQIWQRLDQIGCKAGQLSYPIFLFHWPVLLLLSTYLPGRISWKVAAVYIISVVIIAWTVQKMFMIANFVLKKLPELFRKDTHMRQT